MVVNRQINPKEEEEELEIQLEVLKYWPWISSSTSGLNLNKYIMFMD